MTTDVEVKVDNLVYKVNKDTAHAITLLLGECGELVEEVPVERMWEVLSYMTPEGNEVSRYSDGWYRVHPDAKILNYTQEECIDKGLEIQAIKTKGGDVYRIGDKIVWDWELSARDYFTITAISSTRISLGETYATQDIKILIKSGLRHYTEPVKPVVLMVTTDGKDVVDPEQMLYDLSTENWWKGETKAKWFIKWCDEGICKDRKPFSTPEDRQSWILINRPMLSVKDIETLLQTSAWIEGDLAEFLNDVQQKVVDKLNKL